MSENPTPALENLSRRTTAEPLIAFVHIPKTAGGTLKSVFAEVFGRDAVHDCGNYLRNPAKIAASSFKLHPHTRFTLGHVHYGLLRDRLPRETRYITFLRDPVDRVISHYYRHLRGRADTIADALGSGMPHVTNLMTRFLCGYVDILDELPEDALARAQHAVQSFEFVGFQERFDDSLVLLQEKLGIPMTAYGASRHVNSDRPQPDEAERALIARHNKLDIELYEWARSRFDADAARHTSLTANVEQLRAASAVKAHEQSERTDLATRWLAAALPVGASRPLEELVLAAGSAGFTRAELKRAKRQLRPACRNLWTESGLHWAMAAPGERRRRHREGRSGTPPQ